MVIPISTASALASRLSQSAANADLALVIAPETGGRLLRCLHWLPPGRRRTALNPDLRFTELASDKNALQEFLSDKGVSVPSGGPVHRFLNSDPGPEPLRAGTKTAGRMRQRRFASDQLAGRSEVVEVRALPKLARRAVGSGYPGQCYGVDGAGTRTAASAAATGIRSFTHRPIRELCRRSSRRHCRPSRLAGSADRSGPAADDWLFWHRHGYWRHRRGGGSQSPHHDVLVLPAQSSALQRGREASGNGWSLTRTGSRGDALADDLYEPAIRPLFSSAIVLRALRSSFPLPSKGNWSTGIKLSSVGMKILGNPDANRPFLNSSGVIPICV